MLIYEVQDLIATTNPVDQTEIMFNVYVGAISGRNSIECIEYRLKFRRTEDDPKLSMLAPLKKIMPNEDVAQKVFEGMIKLTSLQAFNAGGGVASMASNLPGVHMMVKHPVTATTNELYTTIMDLNDRHKWTRDQIADWIETFDEVPTFDTQRADQEGNVERLTLVATFSELLS